MYNIALEFSKEKPENHKFIQTTGKPLKGMVTEVSLLVTNQYLRKDYSANKWREIKEKLVCNFEMPPGTRITSKPINYRVISEHIRKTASFDPHDFNLPDLGSMWLDHATEMKLDFYLYGAGISSGDLQTHYYGKEYPIHPMLKREGRMFTSFQPQLIRQIVNKRKELISTSDKALSDEWIFNMRNLVSDAISLVDIACTQLYIKAEYSPLPGWKFNKKILGERHGRRITDKLKWVHQITGKPLNYEIERKSLETLRKLRNHLMHFDPPSLVITLEEATIWLNDIVTIGGILAKLRKAANVDTSIDIINFLLQKEAVFVPYDNTARTPISEDNSEGYASSTWPS